MSFAYLDHPRPIAFAHRGGAVEFPENTPQAFEAALALGFRYLETDVHLTRDGVLVAFHDSRLDRVTDRSGAIADLSWDEVRKARVLGSAQRDGSGGPARQDGDIVRMEDLLEAFPAARFNIDPKADASVEPLVDLIRRTGCVDRVCVGAFSQRRLRDVRSGVGPNLCVSAGPREVAQLRLGSWGLPAGRVTAACAQVPVRIGAVPAADRRFVDHAHRLGLQVHVWTIDDPAEMHRLCDLGVDGIMTDKPSVLRAVLAERGEWA